MNYTKESIRTNHREVGKRYEKAAKTYLEHKGYNILKTNYYCRFGEIDIIAKDKDYVVFLEVKYKKSKAYGYPRESVTYKKRQRLIKSATYFLTLERLHHKPCRFDVIEILEDRINHIENAFI